MTADDEIPHPNQPSHHQSDSEIPGKRPRIVVVGSINMDLVAQMGRLPRPGETVSGETFQMISGGKGANQAVAAARLGASVTLIARVGDDLFGANLRQLLIDEGIDVDSVWTTPDCSTGVAFIGVEKSGANAITVVPGANGRLTVEDVQRCTDLIANSDALMVQLETPADSVAAAIAIAQQHGVRTILDPAPAPEGRLAKQLLSVDVLSPNQTEAESLTGMSVTDWESARQAASHLQQQGAKDIVLKMGAHGALVFRRDGTWFSIAAKPTNVIDTTAAGDAFTGALAVALCAGWSLQQATQYGVTAGTFACTRFGAQPAMPTRAELADLTD
jgi:ribokinase